MKGRKHFFFLLLSNRLKGGGRGEIEFNKYRFDDEVDLFLLQISISAMRYAI